MTTWYVDGAGWNNLVCKTCVMQENGEPNVTVFTEKKTNNECEYGALLEALELAQEKDTIYSDSQMMVNHLNGQYRVRAQHLKPLFLRAKELIREKKVTLLWLRREENLAGKHLEKLE